MSEIIKFPFTLSSAPACNADSPSEPITDAEFEKMHSLAFRELEPLICDCVSMANIAADAVMSIRTAKRSLRSLTPTKCSPRSRRIITPCGAAESRGRRSMRKRNRQRLVSHARRLRR
jgi:hypothetical protein